MNDLAPKGALVFCAPHNPLLATVSWLSVRGALRPESLYLICPEPGAGAATLAAFRRSLAYHAASEGLAEPAIRLETVAPEALGALLAGAGSQKILLVPEQIALDEANDLDITVSDDLNLLVEACDAAGLEIWEDGLRLLYDQPETGPWLTLERSYAEVKALAQSLSDCPLAQLPDWWQGRAGRQYRCLQGLQLWRERLLAQGAELLGPLIARVVRDAGDWGAQLALLLYKRADAGLDPEAAPDWLRPYLAELLAGWGRALTILPPISDFRVSLLLLAPPQPEQLAAAIASLQGQSYQDWQLLIGGESAAACQGLAGEDARIRCFPAAPGDALRVLYAQADTELIVNFAGNLVLKPDYLAACVGFWRAHPWLAAVGSSFMIQGPGQLIQHGPFYPKACIADSKKELQRLGQILTLGPSCVYRKALLQAAGRHDPRAGASEPASWDYFCQVYLMGRYELGFVPERLLSLSEAAQPGADRASAGELLALLAHLLEDYAALFGPEAYPRSVADFFVHCRFDEIQQAFKQTLMTAPDGRGFDAETALQARDWEQLLRVKALVRQHCSDAAELLYSRANPYS